MSYYMTFFLLPYFLVLPISAELFYGILLYELAAAIEMFFITIGRHHITDILAKVVFFFQWYTYVVVNTQLSNFQVIRPLLVFLKNQ